MILDTNALSALFAGDHDLEQILLKAPRLSVPAVVVGEYRYGLIRSRHQERLETILDDFLRVSRVLSVDQETAESYATVREALREQGTPIPENDVWIAAHCRQHSQPLVSRDRHFDHVPELVRLEW